MVIVGDSYIQLMCDLNPETLNDIYIYFYEGYISIHPTTVNKDTKDVLSVLHVVCPQLL